MPKTLLSTVSLNRVNQSVKASSVTLTMAVGGVCLVEVGIHRTARLCSSVCRLSFDIHTRSTGVESR